jgi:hypothetical protein
MSCLTKSGVSYRRDPDNLHYAWPAGFGRFVLEAMNPNVSDLRPAEEALLKGTLGCDLRKIWVHL